LEVKGASSDFGSEATLVLAAQAGDVRAFDTLARIYRRACWFEARKVLGDWKADDAVQDALLIAFKALPMLKNMDGFPGWLRTLTRHRALRIAAGESRQTSALDELLLRYSPNVAHFSELDMALHAELECLPILEHQMIVLHYLEDWSIRQISIFLGLSESTVKWRMHIARKQLRACLESDPLPR
jgi:RNA polymerase sigma-70 factor, ECF subfamily